MRGSSGRTALVGALVVGALLAGATAAAAAPPPPTDPGDAALARSHDAVSARAAQVGKLTGQLAALDARTDDLQADLQARREDAVAALDDLTTAQAAAAEAARKAAEAQVATTAASRAVDDARARLDVFATAVYQEGLDTGPFGLLTGAQDPDDLVGRAEFTDIVARSELTARDGLERARVDRANADSLARAARAEAQVRQAAAAAAKQNSDAALSVADAAAQENARQLAEVAAQRGAVQAQLDAAVDQDANLRAQRQRFRGLAAAGGRRAGGPGGGGPARGERQDRPRPRGCAGLGAAGDRPGARAGRHPVRLGWRERSRADHGHRGRARNGVRLLRADALRVQRRRGLPASGEPQPVQCRPQGADLRPPAW